MFWTNNIPHTIYSGCNLKIADRCEKKTNLHLLENKVFKTEYLQSTDKHMYKKKTQHNSTKKHSGGSGPHKVHF